METKTKAPAKKTGEITGLTLDEIKKLNLWEKMAIATSHMEKAGKDLKIEYGRTSYKAVSESSVLRAVKKIEEELRIYSYPMSRTIVDRDILETEKEYKGAITRSNQIFMRVETRYFFVNIDNPEETLQVMSYGDGLDSGDKASGKAMTYCDKYALMKAYKIETGDDPDAEPSPELKGSKTQKAKTQTESITDAQLTTLKKWGSDENKMKNMLAEIVVSTGRKITELEQLTKYEASTFIGKVIEDSKKRKEQAELKKDLAETNAKHNEVSPADFNEEEVNE